MACGRLFHSVGAGTQNCSPAHLFGCGCGNQNMVTPCEVTTLFEGGEIWRFRLGNIYGSSMGCWCRFFKNDVDTSEPD